MEVLRTCLTSLINWPSCQFLLLLLIAASKTLNLRGLDVADRLPRALEGGDCHVVTCLVSELSV